MTTIIHISADFPDPIVPAKTRAVANLIAASPGFHHVVYSLNRVRWDKGISMTRFGDRHTAIAYGAPPYGIGLTRFLRPVARAIIDDLHRRELSVSLVHAHKFSVEGLIAADVSTAVECPFLCSLWGDTDTRIFEAKRGLRRRYRDIAARSKVLLPAAPWTADYFHRALGVANGKMRLLPVITAGDDILPPVTSHSPRLVSVFSLDSWKRKGLDQLVKAALQAARDIPGLTLDIFGTGGKRSVEAAEAILHKHCALDVVRLRGVLAHDSVQRAMNGYAAFVMAPRRETYGMVHVEALLAGLPILWSRNQGVDGLFDRLDIGYRADPESSDDIAAGIRILVAHERLLKSNIARLQCEGAFEHLRRHRIGADYAGILACLAN
jgi:glycosyltransferase involved in cell wall biosynthesis